MMQSDPVLSEDELLLQLTEGGSARERAVTQLYRQYASRFSGYLYRKGVPENQIEDLIQEAFIRLIQRCGSFEPRGEGGAWIWAVARSAWLDQFRHKQPELVSGDWVESADQLIADDRAADLGFKDCVEGQLHRFTLSYPEAGQALSWAVMDGFSTSEISGLLDRTAGATRQFLSQARKRLMEYLKPCLESG